MSGPCLPDSPIIALSAPLIILAKPANVTVPGYKWC